MRKQTHEEKQIRLTTLADSTIEELLTIKTTPIPMEQATLTVRMDSLLSLPAGAEYTARNGRASTSVKRQGGDVVIVSTCDSLQALVEQYERKSRSDAQRVSNLQTELRTEKERRSYPLRSLFFAYVAGVATCIVSKFFKKRKYGT